jgi:hypothetical protein
VLAKPRGDGDGWSGVRLQVADFMAAGGGARLGDFQHGWTLLHRYVIDSKCARLAVGFDRSVGFVVGLQS